MLPFCASSMLVTIANVSASSAILLVAGGEAFGEKAKRDEKWAVGLGVSR
jgi:hypothetical protein